MTCATAEMYTSCRVPLRSTAGGTGRAKFGIELPNLQILCLLLSNVAAPVLTTNIALR